MRDVDCRPRTFVVDRAGHVGLVHDRAGPDDGATEARVRVGYGPDGPIRCHSHRHLRPATAEDVRAAGLTGVPGRYS